MKFTKLEIQNFLAITDGTIQLDDRGLVLVQGINHADSSAQSNGAGKSSIPDALCWCWFGTTARGLAGDDVINDTAGKNCMVRSTIIDGGMTYTATRHRKHKTGKNSLTITSHDGLRLVDLTKGTDKLTQDVANAIIGASLEVFQGSIYAGQEQMPDLPAMTDKTLKILIEEAAGVTALEGAYKKAREEALTVKENLMRVANNREAVLTKLAFQKAQLTETMTLDTKWKTDHAAQVKLERDRLVEVEGPEVKRLATLFDPADRAKLLAEIADCDAKIAAVGAEQTELQRLAAEVTKHLMNAGNHNMVIERNKQMLEKAHKRLGEINHKIGCPCTECGRPLTAAEMAAASKAEQDRIKELTADQMMATGEEAASQILHRSAVDAHLEFRAKMTDVSAVSASRAALASAVSVLDAKETEYNNRLARLRSDTAALKAKMAEESPHQPMIEKLVVSIAALELDLADANKAHARTAAEEALMAEVVKVFGPAGVRARVLDDVTPYLNAQTSRYLSILSDGNIEANWTTLVENAKGELREKFSIDVTNTTGGKVFKSLSGGEKRKVRIATALALQDLVSTRATKPIEIFIGDEIDDALDPAGLERLMIILEEKATERGSVFIISHNDLKNEIKNVLTVEKMVGGETKITETIL